MYKIVYEKQAIKDIQNLKSAKLDGKAKELIEIVRKYPFQNPPPYERAGSANAFDTFKKGEF